MLKTFTIRVYGLILKDNQLLVSKELYKDKELIKFPGGGQELGESVIDCLYREIQEELSVNVISHKLFHVSEELIQSIFNPNEQVTLIYYLIETDTYQFNCKEFEILWINLDSNRNEVEFTFQQEQVVFNMLKKNINN